jgi:hypothetical protein
VTEESEMESIVYTGLMNPDIVNTPEATSLLEPNISQQKTCETACLQVFI